jgi:hypothetical protein
MTSSSAVFCRSPHMPLRLLFPLAAPINLLAALAFLAHPRVVRVPLKGSHVFITGTATSGSPWPPPRRRRAHRSPSWPATSPASSRRAPPSSTT